MGAAASAGDDLADQCAMEARRRDEVASRRALRRRRSGGDTRRTGAPQVRDHGRGGRRLDAKGCRRRLAGPDRALCEGSRVEADLSGLKRAKKIIAEEIVMSEFIVHTVPGSPFARSVLATLEEKGASYRLA